MISIDFFFLKEPNQTSLFVRQKSTYKIRMKVLKLLIAGVHSSYFLSVGSILSSEPGKLLDIWRVEIPIFDVASEPRKFRYSKIVDAIFRTV